MQADSNCVSGHTWKSKQPTVELLVDERLGPKKEDSTDEKLSTEFCCFFIPFLTEEECLALGLPLLFKPLDLKLLLGLELLVKLLPLARGALQSKKSQGISRNHASIGQIFK